MSFYFSLVCLGMIMSDARGSGTIRPSPSRHRRHMTSFHSPRDSLSTVFIESLKVSLSQSLAPNSEATHWDLQSQ